MAQLRAGDVDDLISIADGARLIGFSSQAVRNWIGQGRLSVVIETPGGRKRISRTELLQLVTPTTPIPSEAS